ncbi:hypothetical protein ACERII_22005 [Evansella sp. AB-rgal1]|uniref:hypothetical protein n=1 Tax=Evansella sp. AB-rgal1 TaxID=3242696 RepID=UPI00359D7F0A
MDEKKKISKKRLYIGITLTFFGVVGGISSDIESIAEEGLAQSISSILSFTIPVIVLGIYLIRSYFQKVKKVEAEYVERVVLQVVKKNGGSITVTDLAASSELSITEAKNVLEDICKNGLAERRLTDSGAMVYRFSTVLTAQEKENAKGLY